MEIPKNSPEIIGNSIQKIVEHNQFNLSVKNFLFVENKKILFVLLSDNDFVSRDEISLDNVLLIRNNGKEPKKPLGYVIIYEYIKIKCEKDVNNGEEYKTKINKLWEKNVLIQTNILFFDEKKEFLCFGNDDGSIYIYKTKIEGNFKEMELITELTFHTDRVSGIYLDSNNMNIYSCSYDNTFFVTDLKDNLYTKSLIYNNICSFTGLKYIDKNNLFITSDEDGVISIYTNENSHHKYFTNFLNIQSKSLYKINTMKIYENFIIAGENNGKISIFDLSLIKDKIIKEIINFDIGTFKIICIDYNSKKDEIIIGDENGRIIIWNNKIGNYVYSLIAHSQAKINHLWFEKDKNILWTCGDDKIIKIWKIPEKWFKEENNLFIKNNINLDEKQKENKILDLEENESISSDEDELNGWSYK